MEIDGEVYEVRSGTHKTRSVELIQNGRYSQSKLQGGRETVGVFLVSRRAELMRTLENHHGKAAGWYQGLIAALVSAHIAHKRPDDPAVEFERILTDCLTRAKELKKHR